MTPWIAKNKIVETGPRHRQHCPLALQGVDPFP